MVEPKNCTAGSVDGKSGNGCHIVVSCSPPLRLDSGSISLPGVVANSQGREAIQQGKKNETRKFHKNASFHHPFSKRCCTTARTWPADHVLSAVPGSHLAMNNHITGMKSNLIPLSVFLFSPPFFVPVSNCLLVRMLVCGFEGGSQSFSSLAAFLEIQMCKWTVT